MQTLTHNERETINMYIKNGKDIANLIKDRNIKGENLNRAIITKLERVKDDISGCSFAFAKIGNSEDIVKILETKMQNCNFECTEFIGRAWIRSCDAQNCNFKGADVSKVDYRYTNFLGCSFCESVIKISTRSGIGCQFPKSMFEELCKGWAFNIKIEDTKKETV